mgnify:CR=1 FL=1
MLESDILLAHGRRARPGEAGIAILEPSGDVREMIPYADVGSVGREGQAVTFHARAGGSRTLIAASILDADRLVGILPADVPVSFVVTSNSLPTATPAFERPEQQVDGSGNTVRWVATGCLSLFSLFLLCPIAFLVFWVADGADGGLDDTERGTLVAGESGEVGGPLYRYDLTILEIQDNAVSSVASEVPVGDTRFWTVRVRVENTGLLETSDSFFGSPDWFLRLRGGGSVGEDSDLQGFGPIIDDALILAAGEDAEGTLVFRVPADRQIESLVLSMGVNDDELVLEAP